VKQLCVVGAKVTCSFEAKGSNVHSVTTKKFPNPFVGIFPAWRHTWRGVVTCCHRCL